MLFFGVNILITITISLIMGIFGVGHWLTASGINYSALMVFCLLWGMGGSFINLLISKWLAKKMMGVEIVSSTGQYKDLVQMVHSSAKRAGMTTMPEVGVYNSPDINAFATGPSKKNSLVAVSTGLLNRMSAQEIEGVVGHEVAHIANGDMVTMTLIQGVMNAFVMFFARIAAYAVSQAMRGDRDDDNRGGATNGFMFHMIVMGFELVFGILASLVINAFSRYREFRADEGGARLAGKEKMIAALEGLKRNMNMRLDENAEQPNKSFQTMQISTRKSGGFLKLFSTHPDLDDRIKALTKRRAY
jgi:heat shock protein HtpX